MTSSISAQSNTVVYRHTIDQEIVNKSKKDITWMTINGNIPGPTSRFSEGEYAVIYVENKMDMETFFEQAIQINPNVSKITGLIYGYRIDDELIQKNSTDRNSKNEVIFTLQV